MPAFQLTERSFRRYEQAIKQAVDNFPNPTAFNPSPLSPNTFAARLRDAIKSLEMYDWKTTINRQRLGEIRTDFCVRINKNSNVVISPRNSELETIGRVDNQVQTTKASTLTNVTETELMALITLLSNSRIPPVKVSGLPLATINLACQGYDVEFIEEGDGVVLL